MSTIRNQYTSAPYRITEKRGLFKKGSLPATPEMSPAEEVQPAAPQNAGMQNPQQINALFSQLPDMPTPPGPSSPASPAAPMGFNPIMTAPQMPQTPLFPSQPPMGSPFASQTMSNPMPPLGNQPVTRQNQPFMPHMQGFSPAQMNQPTQSVPFMNNAPVMNPTAPVAPSVQPAGFDANVIGNASFAPQNQQLFQNPSFMAQPNPNHQQAPNSITRDSNGSITLSLNVDTLWKLFLFLLLPALFIASLFVPSSMNLLRYVFLALCAAGLGVIWHRQMFSKPTRTLVSGGYAVACIAVILVMLLGGSQDTRQPGAYTSNNQQMAQQPQQQVPPAAVTAELTPTPEPEPTAAPISDAELRLRAFMDNWAAGRIESMVHYVQPSWTSDQDNPSNRLFVLLSNRTPLSYNIEEISGSDADSSRTVSMTANIDKNNGKDPILYRFLVLMVKEGGEWYVDPNSLATNDTLNEEETAVVNDSRNTGAENWTVAPRQTVTPAPPSTTLLYYNADGGSFYHLDQYCPNVKDEYLPLTGTFTYAELGNYSLLPCLKCDAPTQTLPPDMI